ncbi:MAG: tRNA dihydrouridine synthase [Planctomycetota bacterium]
MSAGSGWEMGEARGRQGSCRRRLSLSLGRLQLDVPLLAAPIAGFTDRVLRGIVRDFGGCGLIFTEMVSAGGWVRGNIPPERLRGVRQEPRPLGVQLWDREPAMIEEAARRLADRGISVIDLNFGCPKRRIMGKQGAGAVLLRDPATVGALVAAAVRGGGGIPVTAKLRLGPSRSCLTAPEVARAAEENGAAAVTVHGRRAGESYAVPCDLDGIAEVVQAVSIPVIANGDVDGPAAAIRTLERSGAAGLMVARAALSRPWVFRDIACALRGEPVPPPPTLIEQRDLLLGHHGLLVAEEGDPRGTVLMRKFACRCLFGVPGARDFRAAISRARDSADFRSIVERLFPAGGAERGGEHALARAGG